MSNQKNQKGNILKNIAIAFLIIFGVAVAVASVFIMSILMDTPDIDPKKMVFTENSLIYDSNGKVIEKLESSGSSRDLIKSLDDIPQELVNAVLAIEDHNFYEHSGINIKRILGAVVKNIKSGYKAQGASTITQQLSKNLYLTSEKTYKRKIKEVYYSFILEKSLTKDEIMVAYLNTIFLGSISGVSISIDIINTLTPATATPNIIRKAIAIFFSILPLFLFSLLIYLLSLPLVNIYYILVIKKYYTIIKYKFIFFNLINLY